MATEKTSRNTLKGYFKKNMIPTEANFSELIDGMLHQNEDGITKLPGEPLKVAGTVAISDGIPHNGSTLEKMPGVLQIRKDVSKGLGPILSIVNGAGDLGASAAIDFYTYCRGEHPPNARIEMIDDGGGCGNLIVSAKRGTENGAKGGLVETLRITSKGAVVISDGKPDAAINNRMAPGSLSIGSFSRSYGGGNDGKTVGWTENVAALLLETAKDTEIAVHEKGKDFSRLRGLLYFEGGGKNQITIGRNKGFDVPECSQVDIPGVLTVGSIRIGIATPSTEIRKFHVATQDSGVGMFESSDKQAILQIFAKDGFQNRVEMCNRGNGRLALWTAVPRKDDPSKFGEDVLNITKAGNVGIGTETPDAKLDVNGDAKVSGKLLVKNCSISLASEDIYIVRGVVGSDGQLENGENCSVKKILAGVYEITFGFSYSKLPSVVVTQIYKDSNCQDPGDCSPAF